MVLRINCLPREYLKPWKSSASTKPLSGAKWVVPFGPRRRHHTHRVRLAGGRIELGVHQEEMLTSEPHDEAISHVRLGNGQHVVCDSKCRADAPFLQRTSIMIRTKQ